MRVLVTGCHGFLGHHVTALLLERGHEVIGVDRISGARSPKADRIAAFATFGDRAQFLEGHLDRWEFVANVMREVQPDAVFHAAGQYSVTYNDENDEHYIRSNLVAAYHLTWSVPRVFGTPRVVFASSAAVSDARRPAGAYGATKGVGEDLLAAAAKRFKVSGIALRFGVLYGPMIRPDTEFHRTIAHLLEGRPAKASSQFDKRAPMIEIADAAELAVRAIECKAKGMHTIPGSGPDGPWTYREALHAAARLTGLAPNDPQPRPVVAPPIPVDQSTVRQLLGWSPAVTLPQGLERYIRWARISTT